MSTRGALLLGRVVTLLWMQHTWLATQVAQRWYAFIPTPAAMFTALGCADCLTQLSSIPVHHRGRKTDHVVPAATAVRVVFSFWDKPADGRRQLVLDGAAGTYHARVVLRMVLIRRSYCACSSMARQLPLGTPRGCQSHAR